MPNASGLAVPPSDTATLPQELRSEYLLAVFGPNRRRVRESRCSLLGSLHASSGAQPPLPPPQPSLATLLGGVASPALEDVLKQLSVFACLAARCGVPCVSRDRVVWSQAV